MQEAQRKPNDHITRHLKKEKLELVRHNSNRYRKYMGMFFNFMRQSLILALKSGNEFVLFKSLSVCLFQIHVPRDDIANLVSLSKIFGSLKVYSLYLVE